MEWGEGVGEGGFLVFCFVVVVITVVVGVGSPWEGRPHERGGGGHRDQGHGGVRRHRAHSLGSPGHLAPLAGEDSWRRKRKV